MANTTKKPFKSKLYGCLVRSVGIMWVFIFGIIIGGVLGFLAGRYYPVWVPSLVTTRNVIAPKTVGEIRLDGGVIFTVTEFQRAGELVDVFYTTFNDGQYEQRLRFGDNFFIKDDQNKRYSPWVGVYELIEEEAYRLIRAQQPYGGNYNPGYGPPCCWHLVYRIPADRTGLALVIGNYTIPLE